MIEELKPLIGKLSIFAKDRMGFSHPPKLFIKQSKENANKMLGRTAHYDPNDESITLFVTARHPKDILRSYAHELVHHAQNLRGDLSPEKSGHMSKNYAQDNKHMRNMEKEAYLQGNMCFRDFEDTLDDKDIYKIKLAESKFLKENKKMTTKITKEYLKSAIEKIVSERLKEGAVPPQFKANVEKKKAAAKEKDSDQVQTEENEELEEGDIGMRSVKAGADNNPEETKMDHIPDAALKKAAKKNKKDKKEKQEESKVQTPEQENTLYEQRFTPKNNRLYEKLVKQWTK